MLDLVSVGVVVIFIGIAIVFASMLRDSRSRGEVRGGGVILIGPIPIIFGTDAKWASVAIVLAVVLIILSLLFYLG